MNPVPCFTVCTARVLWGMEWFIDNKHFLPSLPSFSLSFHMPLCLGDECLAVVIVTTKALWPRSSWQPQKNSQTINFDSGCMKGVGESCLSACRVLLPCYSLLLVLKRRGGLLGNLLSAWRTGDMRGRNYIGAEFRVRVVVLRRSYVWSIGCKKRFLKQKSCPKQCSRGWDILNFGPWYGRSSKNIWSYISHNAIRQFASFVSPLCLENIHVFQTPSFPIVDAGFLFLN